MNDIKISYDGNCPKCASSDWQLVCDLFTEGSSHGIDNDQDALTTSAYAPPLEPSEYWSKNNRLINCQKRVDEAPKVRNCLWLLKEKFEDDRKTLLECQTYEKNKALWSKTRVCSQCGAQFVTKADFQSAVASFEVPEWPPCL